jgi:hypothetical protein
MSSFVNTLNLRPQEKRVIVVIGVIVFAVLNVLLVFPHFHDWGKIKLELADTEGKIETFNKKIYQDTNSSPDGLKNILRRMSEGKDGTIPQYSDLALETTVTTEAAKSGVKIRSYQPAPPKSMGPSSQSDKYFESQAVRITVDDCPEEAYVKFLYNVGNDPAMIRVHELSLSAKDANRYGLSASITLIADYQKNTDTNAPKKTAPATKPKPPAPPAPGVTSPPAPDRRGAGVRANPPPTNQPPARRGNAPVTPPQVPMIPRLNRPKTNG